MPDLVADDVLLRAGVPRSILYQLWNNFDEYRREVLIELLRSSERQDPADMMDSVVPILERGGSTAEVLLTGSLVYFERFARSDMLKWTLAAYPHRDEIEIGPVIAANLNSARDRFAPPLGVLIAAARRHPRPGLDATVIAQLMVALYPGMAIRERVDPGVAFHEMPWTDSEGNAQMWPRVSVAAQAIIARCTEVVS
ncbi:MAG: hypothetical protein P8N02_05985 [Actinomycetota bacterium]|nr:hypothetical protein [Actinomycetota bacterium]